MSLLKEISIIIPVGPHETLWKALLDNLREESSEFKEVEVVLVGPEPMEAECRVVHSPLGRAIQMNTGAQAATRSYLWFLHADSILEPGWKNALEKVVTQSPGSLFYFELRFDDDGPVQMPVNTFGTWFRSTFLRMPFGDQGFFISKKVFFELGGFNTEAPYGEDHLLVWKAHQKGVPVRSTGATIQTSARKYQKQGWGKTTLTHLKLTFTQAAPEFLKFAKERWKLK